MLNICVVASGGGSNLQVLIDACDKRDINGDIKLVISNNKEAYALERSKACKIKSIYINPDEYKTNEEYNDEILKRCKEENIDLIVLAGYLKILSGKILDEYKERIINIHPSLIPSFCGAGYYGDRVHKGVLDYGVKYTGATVHFVDNGTDTGPIIMQEVVSVDEDDDLESLKNKVLNVEHKILKEAVKLFCEGRISVDKRLVRINQEVTE